MKLSTFVSVLALFAVIALAHAHAHLKMSTPADASVVTASPANIVLQFSEAARLTAAWIQKDDGPKQKLTTLPDKPAVEVSVALPALEPGTYVVSWRALSDDGHVVPGQIHFTLSAHGGADHPAQH
jgi:methionine-rich copper-binding protein CopC